MIKHQKGATLFTALMILMVLSIIGLSSAKIASLNIKIASNEQQRMRLQQKAQSLLKRFITIKQFNYWQALQLGQAQGHNALDQHVFEEYTPSLMPFDTYQEGNFIIQPTIRKVGLETPCITTISAPSEALAQANQVCCQRYDFSIQVSFYYQSARQEVHQIINKKTLNQCTTD